MNIHLSQESPVVVLIIIMVVVLAGCGLYNDQALDNKEYGVSCEHFPTPDQVATILAEHDQAVQQFSSINPGQIFVDIDTETCPGRAGVAISYASHSDRQAIERIIDGDTLWGVPYKLRNR